MRRVLDIGIYGSYNQWHLPSRLKEGSRISFLLLIDVRLEDMVLGLLRKRVY